MLVVMMAAWAVLSWPARATDLLADAGGGLYEIRITTFSEDDQPLFETRGRLRIDALDEGQWRVRLLSAEVFDRYIGRWDAVIVDSVDPRALDLPDGVLVEFVVDGEPDLTTLIPEDIPNIAFGLLLETTTFLAICSAEGGLDSLEDPGDSTAIDGFTLFWRRPHGSPANRRVLRPGQATFEGIEDGVATVSVRPEGIHWTTVRGYGDFRLSLGHGDFPITIRVDAETGALQSVAVERSMLTFREFGEVPDATLPDRDEVIFPADAPSFTTRRAVELERIDDSD